MMSTFGDFRELVVKSVGKPDARNGHVRFDERGRETTGCHSVPVPRPSSTLPRQTSALFSARRSFGSAHLHAMKAPFASAKLGARKRNQRPISRIFLYLRHEMRAQVLQLSSELRVGR